MKDLVRKKQISLKCSSSWTGPVYQGGWKNFPTFALYNFFGDKTALEGAKALLSVKFWFMFSNIVPHCLIVWLFHRTLPPNLGGVSRKGSVIFFKTDGGQAKKTRKIPHLSPRQRPSIWHLPYPSNYRYSLPFNFNRSDNLSVSFKEDSTFFLLASPVNS